MASVVITKTPFEPCTRATIPVRLRTRNQSASIRHGFSTSTTASKIVAVSAANQPNSVSKVLPGDHSICLARSSGNTALRVKISITKPRSVEKEKHPYDTGSDPLPSVRFARENHLIYNSNPEFLVDTFQMPDPVQTFTHGGRQTPRHSTAAE